MSVDIQQIKALRDKTGVSMTACKKALEEAGGDEAKAIELLRKKGEAKAAERSDRSTENGVVAVVQEGNKAAMLALACETDFVAKNEDFVAQAKKLAQMCLEQGESIDLSNELSDLNIQMGEKIQLQDKKVVEGEVIGSYLHGNNRIGVLVVLSGGAQETAKDIAMHVAAMNPSNISPNDVEDALVAKEKEIWTEQLKQENKPENIWENIMKGKEKKFREASALLTQAFVKNPEQKIEAVLGDAAVEAFYRFSV